MTREEKKQTLTKRQREFCEEYIKNGYNQTQAYLKIYENSSYDSAAVGANKIMKKPHVRDYITQLQKEAFAAACISAERVALKLGEIAFAEKDDEYYGASAQLKALDLIQKQLGLQTQNIHAEVDTEINITIGEDE